MAIKNPWPNIKDIEFNDNTTLSSSMINSGFEFIKDQEVTIEKTGEVVTFKNCNTNPFIKVLCDIKFAQSGTGDPSPDNIRPITAYSTINVTNDDTVYPIALGQTVGIGEVETIEGTLIVNYGVVDLSTLTWTSSGSGTNARWYCADLTSVIKKPQFASQILDMTMEQFKPINYGATLADNPNYISVLSDGRLITYKYDENSPSGLCVYPLETPIETTITPVMINSIEGNNNVYHDANGDITVKYKTTIRCLMNQ